MELPAPSEWYNPHIGRADGTGVEQVAHDAGRGVAAEIFSYGDNALVARGCVEDLLAGSHCDGQRLFH